MNEKPNPDTETRPSLTSATEAARSTGAMRTLSTGPLAHLTLAAGSTVLVMFLVWEALEQRVATNDATAHLMHYSRGVSTSLVTAAVVAWFSYRNHRARAATLEQAVERRTRELGEARQWRIAWPSRYTGRA